MYDFHRRLVNQMIHMHKSSVRMVFLPNARMAGRTYATKVANKILMEQKILEILKQRDQELIERFCQPGSYIDDTGKQIHGICKQVDVSVMLNFIHVHDAHILEALKDA